MTPLDRYMNERWTVAGVSKTRYEVYVDLYGQSVNYGHYGDAELWLKAWGKRETSAPVQREGTCLTSPESASLQEPEAIEG